MAMSTEKKKVLLTKSDMDTHDRGVRYVAQVLRDAGMEVIFVRYRIPEEVVQVAMQEGADVIGLSFYSAGAVYDTSVVMKMLKEQHLDDIQVVVGGVLPEEDVAEVKQMGVKEVFGPGRPIAEVVGSIAS